MERNKIYSPLTDKELIQKAYWWIEQLIKSGGKDFVMHVPAQLDHDTDLVFFNLAKRFENLLTKYENILATEDGHISQTENVWQSGYATGHEAATERHKPKQTERELNVYDIINRGE